MGRDGSNVPWFFTITLLFKSIVTWDYGIHRGMGCFGTNQTRMTTQLGVPCVQWPRTSSLRTFLSYKEVSFFFFCQTKHAAFLVYAVRVWLEEEKTDKWTIPISLMLKLAWLRVHPHDIIHDHFIPAFSINTCFIVKTWEWTRPVKLKKWFKSKIGLQLHCVCVCAWINKADDQLYIMSILANISADDTTQPGSHVGSGYIDVILKSSVLAHTPYEEKKTWNQEPQNNCRLDVTHQACVMNLMGMARSDITQTWSIWIIWDFTKIRAMDRTVFNLFLFPKSLIVVVTLWKH